MAAIAAGAAFQPRSLRDVELDHIRLTLDFYEGNKSRAARALGISRQTLRDKLREPGDESRRAADRLAERGLAESLPRDGQIPTSLARS